MVKRPKGIQIMSENEDSEGTGIVGKCIYDWDTRLYTIEVRYGEHKKSESFQALYEPLFGMDVSDQQQGGIIGDRLIEELETELNLKRTKP